MEEKLEEIKHLIAKADSRVQRFIIILFNTWDHMTVTVTAGRILSGLRCLAMSAWVYIHTGLIGGSKCPSGGCEWCVCVSFDGELSSIPASHPVPAGIDSSAHS